MNEKDRRLAEWCRRKGVDGVWLRRRSNIAWIADGADVHVDGSSSTGVASLLWTPRKKVVFTDNIEAARLRDEEFGREWEIRESDWWKRREIPVGNYATDLPEDPLAELRAPLTAAELARVRTLGAEAGALLGEVLRRVRRGSTEQEVAGEIAGRLRAQGRTAAVLLVAADARIAKYRHPVPTFRRVDRTLMVALCPRERGLMVALTRLVHFGKRLPAALRRRHEAVCRVDAAMQAATAPGQRWCDILAVGLQVYREVGFPGEWRRHHQGGPLGYEGRDFRATPTETRVVQEDQPVGWNPSIAGTKSEDTILSDGELLTPTPDWPLCGTRPGILLR